MCTNAFLVVYFYHKEKGVFCIYFETVVIVSGVCMKHFIKYMYNLIADMDIK